MTERPQDDETDDSLLRQMLEDASRRTSAGRRKESIADLISALPQRVAVTGKPTPERLTAEIDALVSAQVDEVLALPEVQKLCLAWQGLKELVDAVDFDENVCVTFLNCSKEELADDFDAATSVTVSGLYQRLCEKDLWLEGGQYSPISLIVTDYEFDSRQREIELLGHCAAVAADAHALFTANASPEFFGFGNFSDFSEIGDMARMLEGPRYAAWQSFRDTEDARYVALCAPHASRAFAAQVAASFAKRGMFGGLIGKATIAGEGLDVTAELERDLSEGGFVALVASGSTGPRFPWARSAFRPRRFADTQQGREAAISSRASAELENILTISRLAHFVEAIAMGLAPNMDATNLERALQQWLSDSATGAPRLGDAHIAITECGYLRYELAVRRVERAPTATSRVAGRLD